ncbi:HNH endonuclease [Anaerobacillus sp. CMMVII]|uniref:HNH endonuclease n=1 Tax=Anaerobacillus sp. CMMVII TaxID=2755588 RepID=UPI0021B8371C|nr:hypothetical protein [Anaerobacillus sp. CMMVII]MCT8138680.1 HNH endonuclease [Anaerobacillus sp. CMMVII]
MEKRCLDCGKMIKVKPSHYDRKKYCSRICKSNYQKKHPPLSWEEMSLKIKTKCSNCGKAFSKKRSTIKKNNFCSIECMYEHFRKEKGNQHLVKKIKLTCHYCQNDFYVIYSRKDTAKYCSKNCLGKANGQRAKIAYRKRTIVHCVNCIKQIEKKPSVVRKRNFCSEKCMGEYYAKSGMFSGENSGTWQGGDIDYYGPNWREQRRMARSRDHFTCQECGKTEDEYGQELSVHHKIPFREFGGDWKKANQLSNLISLCEYPCHRNRHRNSN